MVTAYRAKANPASMAVTAINDIVRSAPDPRPAMSYWRVRYISVTQKVRKGDGADVHC